MQFRLPLGFCLVSVLGVLSASVETDPVSFSTRVFDYVVVGGGTAGLTVAVRLSENPNISVGVIDAGPFLPDDALINTPFEQGLALGNSTLDWQFMSTPQTHAKGRNIAQPRGLDYVECRGKVLGGSSAINYMVFQRASKADYDAWTTLGNKGWNWTGLLPFFKMAETVTPGPSGIFPGAEGHPGANPYFEGSTGPLKIGFNTFYSSLLAPYVDAFRKNGAHTNSDIDTGNATGIFNAPRTVDDNTRMRSYSANAYWAPNANRSNLVVLGEAQATQIELSLPSDKAQYVASGVKFSFGGQEFCVKARKEVILSAGTFKTPQLLELSGIGNKTLLEKLNIKTLIDLPQVGENLQDHLLMGSDYILKEPAPLTWDALRFNATLLEQQEQQYALNRTGLFASNNAAFAYHPLQAFMPMSMVQAMVAQVDSETAHSNLTNFQRKQFDIQRQWLLEGSVGQLEFTLGPGGGESATNVPLVFNASYISIIVGLSHPFSRGSVHINTTDGLVSPLIDPNYLSHAFDLNALVFGMKLARKIAGTPPLAGLVDRLSTPPANVTSDADFADFIKTFVNVSYIYPAQPFYDADPGVANFNQPTYHPIGTAALAPQSLGGVVNESLVVYGTSNLRVVDASVIPLLVAAHTQATVYAIAEKAAHIIKTCQ